MAVICLVTSACSSVEYVPEKRNYSAKAEDLVRSKDRQLGTLYLAKKPGKRSDDEFSLQISRKHGRYRAVTGLTNMTPAPTNLAISNRGRDFRAGLEWSWHF